MYLCFFFLSFFCDIHPSCFFIRFCIIYFFLVTTLKKIPRAATTCVAATAIHLRKTTRPIQSKSKTTETGILLTSFFLLLLFHCCFCLFGWINFFFFIIFPHLCFYSVEVLGKRSIIMQILYGESYDETKNAGCICLFFFCCVSFVNHFLCNVILNRFFLV